MLSDCSERFEVEDSVYECFAELPERQIVSSHIIDPLAVLVNKSVLGCARVGVDVDQDTHAVAGVVGAVKQAA